MIKLCTIGYAMCVSIILGLVMVGVVYGVISFLGIMDLIRR